MELADVVPSPEGITLQSLIEPRFGKVPKHMPIFKPVSSIDFNKSAPTLGIRHVLRYLTHLESLCTQTPIDTRGGFIHVDGRASLIKFTVNCFVKANMPSIPNVCFH